ncbi:hypothetical protein MHYP_G00254190 [Metynnis hypsauchen]
MLSLAISDLLTLLPLPVWIYALLHDWVFGLGLCKFFSYVVYWSLYSSVLCVTLLSVQRYVQVLHPQKWAKIRARGQNGLRHVKLEKDGRLHCKAQYYNNSDRVGTLILETVVMFTVPFPLLVYFSVRLHRGVRQSAFFNTRRMTRLVSALPVIVAMKYLSCSSSTPPIDIPDRRAARTSLLDLASLRLLSPIASLHI